MNKKLVYIIASVLTGFISCKKVYTPQLVSVSTNFLAVDGNIISGDSTFITLSRTTSLTDAIKNKVELKAIVSIESDQGTLYPLTEKGKGVYVRDVTILDAARKYRLNIKTSDAKVYQSDFVPMKVTPPIDNVYFKQTADNELTFYADTHDATDNTRYYRWDYIDTWKYVPVYTANYKYKNGVITPITLDSPDDISSCYRTSNSTEIIIGSSAKLTQDFIKQQRITNIFASSEKIAYTYIIQLRQYALTKEAFEYYQNLKTNTEQLGSIFDQQPSFLIGNIRCVTKPSEKVVGFISASTIAKKQIDLKRNDHNLRPPVANNGISKVNTFAYPKPYYMDDCSLGPYNDLGEGHTWSISGAHPGPDAKFNNRANIALASGDSLLFDVDYGIALGRVFYFYAPKICVDCRLKGGTNIRPPYYPRN